MHSALTLLCLAISLPASAAPQLSPPDSGTDHAPDFSSPLVTCDVMAGDGPDVVTIYVNPKAKTVTALIATPGAYSIKEMPGIFAPDTITFGDGEVSWTLNRTKLTLTKSARDLREVATTKQCTRAVYDH